MRANVQPETIGRLSRGPARLLAEQAFSRTAGAPLIPGNSVRLLRNAEENYPAWLQAIHAARDHIHFESYIIHEDDVGRRFAEALISKAKEGVKVRVLYDWMGAFRKTSRRFWNTLRAAGVEVRCYNPPRFESPFGWVSRDHRKSLSIDGEVAFVTGLCVGRAWVGDPARNIDPWRDTGVEVRGNAVGEIELAFANLWAGIGEPIPREEMVRSKPEVPAGDTSVRVVATLPMTAGISRVDELVSALARKTLWLTDAYYAGTTSYVQALKAAAKDGVDVRLLVPSGTDIPILRPLSRAGYRPLLEAGVRVFEWNGTMLHAKTAVADGHWARVGSSNLNIASWFGNCELDVVVEDERFAEEMEEMYLDDLTNSTEIVLDLAKRIRQPKQRRKSRGLRKSGGGSAGRAAAGALRVGNAVGAAFTNRRAFEPMESQTLVAAGLLMFVLAIVLAFYPAVLVYPAIGFWSWMGIALLIRAYRLRRSPRPSAPSAQRRRSDAATSEPTTSTSVEIK